MQENNQTNNTPNSSDDSIDLPTPIVESAETNIAVDSIDSAVYDVPDITPETVVVPTTTTEEVRVTEVVGVDPTSTASEPAVVLASTNKKQILLQYGIATLVVLVMGGGLLYALEQQGRVSTGVFDKISAVINPAPAPAAAKVNGTKITKADYEKNLLQLTNAATAQGADVATEPVQAEIKKQAIDVLVNTELLRQEAYKEGALVTEEQVEARYQEIIKSLGGMEQLMTKMKELGITEPALRKDIEGEILIQGHLSKAVDTSKIAISEKELADAYGQISGTAAAGVTVPPLAEIKTQLEAQLKTNKEQELVNAYITKIREAAEIEILI